MKPRPRRGFLREAAVAVSFLALSCAMTWPWAAGIAGRVPDRGDPYLLSWVLAWDFHQVFRAPLHLFDANILFPLRRSLAFSNSLLGVFLPLFWLPFLGLRPIAVYGISGLAGFAFTGYAAFRLARTAVGSPKGAFLGSLAFTFLPGRLLHLGHVQLLWAGWAALLFEAVILYVRSPDRGHALWMGTCFFFNALTDVYWLLLTLVPAAAAFALLAYARGAGRRTWARAALSLGAAAIALVPFLYPYARAARDNGFTRGAGENNYFSATPADWLAVNPAVRVDRIVLNRDPPNRERAVFPGFGILLLAAAGIAPRARNDPHSVSAPAGTGPVVRGLDALFLAAAAAATLAFLFWPGEGTSSVRHAGAASLVAAGALIARLWVRLPRFLGGARLGGWRDALRSSASPELHAAGAWAVLGFVDSLGMHTPYHRLLWKLVVPYRAMRVPARAQFVAALGLSVLAAAGAARLLRASRRPRFAFLLIGVALLAELRVAPITLAAAEVEARPVDRWLATAPMAGGIVELPMGFGSYNFLYTLRAADHWRPLVNGTSGFQPEFERHLEEMSRRDPLPPEWMDALEAVPVSYVVVHRGTLSPDEGVALDNFLATESREGRIRFVARFPAGTSEDEVWAVVRTGRRRPHT